MKKFTFFLLCSLLAASCGSSDPWKQADKIVSSMTKVSFPEREVSISDLGAVPGDSLNPCHDVINLAIINMLPLPALDGGRILFVIFTMVTGRSVSAKVEGTVHMIGMALLFGLMIYVTMNDVTRIFG